ncbi:MAG: hypothetical protein R3D98_03565 [Candidatus Krumholzibacteriia bacterium]
MGRHRGRRFGVRHLAAALGSPNLSFDVDAEGVVTEAPHLFEIARRSPS